MGSVRQNVRQVSWLALSALLLAAPLYFYGLTRVGLLGPDEPRYAAIAREMAHSGDWVTPRLWGDPWFEKPALLYWMSAAGFRAGLGAELAPRLPVAAMAAVFLGFYWWILRREFGLRPACLATVILGTSLGWVGFSQLGVTDLPMTATFAAAMFLAIPWIAKGDTRLLPLAAALLGLAVLAKGLVPLVLALPLVMRGRFRDLLRWRVIAPFVLVALPWYVLCYLRNGLQFLEVFFGQQQFARFASPALEHAQPWWFYLPVLLAGLLPWTPVAALAAGRANWRDPRRAFLLIWVLWGLLFFSLAVNKLPGYMLPLAPAVCALMGIGLAEAGGFGLATAALTASAVLLVAFPLATQVLPVAVASGLSRAPIPTWDWRWLLPVVLSAFVWLLARRGRTLGAAAVVALGAASGFLYLKVAALPEIDRAASARSLWREIEPKRAEVCVESINRNFRYGLNYYSGDPLPDCSRQPEPLALRQSPRHPPYLAPASVDPSSPRVVPSPRNR
jgi:4-amino-4-deoxy-L-arabinose transferase-like glycosyltransferase